MASASDQIRNESFYEIKEQGYRITMNNTLWTFFSSYVFTCIECIFCLLIHINKYRANEIEKIEIVVRQLFVIQLFVGYYIHYITYMYECILGYGSVFS